MRGGRQLVSLISLTGILLAGCSGQRDFGESNEASSTVYLNEHQLLIDDMIVDVGALNRQQQDGKIRPEGLYSNNDLWPNGRIPVRFENNVNESQKAMFFDACSEWSKVANITCFPKTNEKKSLKVESGKYNRSAVGAGSFGVFLYRFSRELQIRNWNKWTVVHEIGHSLGLWHEHQRPDRDQYVKINENNIQGHAFSFIFNAIKFNFKIRNDSDPIGPYDFESIMHYPAYAWAKDRNKPTIEPLPQYAEYLEVMGQRDELSEGDKQTALTLYGPPVSKSLP